MGRLTHVNVEIVVGEDRASRWRNADDLLPEIHLVDDFTEDSMKDAVPASRAIMERGGL
jgi:hypothetical protein